MPENSSKDFMIAPPGKHDGQTDMVQDPPFCRGAVVAIVGPDGTGKSTTIDEIRKQLACAGSDVSRITRHWRPDLLPALGQLGGKERVEVQFGGPPRRSPGRFQFLRLAYYGLDFIAGHLLKDNVEKKKNRVVLYDRCALDMHVDPVRYGLKSSRGTRLLWRAVPRPDAIVLLYDAPGRILARKAELSRSELERQFAVWIKLAAERQVDAVVRVNSSPREIARRITSYLNGKAVNEGSAWQGAIARRRMLGSVLHMLAGDPNGSESRTDREQKSADRQGIQFAVIPGISAPRFLIPLASGITAANSLRIYSAHKPLAKAYKWALVKSLRIGLAQPWLRRRIVIADASAGKESLAGALPLQKYLAQALGRREIFLAVSLGTPSAHQKPLFQVMDREGHALAYAKIGWSEDTIRIVESEAQALEKLAGKRFSSASIPRALIAEHWNGYFLLLQSGPVSEGWQPSRDLSASHLQFLSELNAIDLTKKPLQESVWWGIIQARIKALDEMGAAYDADLVRWAVEECVVRFGETNVSFGMKHGDFTPWNMVQRDGELFVFDWEYAEGLAPLGSDLFHFIVQNAVLVKKKGPQALWREMLRPGATNRSINEYFADASLDVGLIPCFLTLYCADVLTWYLCRNRTGRASGFEPLRDAWRHLLLCFVLDGAREKSQAAIPG